MPAAAAVVDELDFEKVLAERVADLKQRLPSFDTLVESDPALKLQEIDACRELLARHELAPMTATAAAIMESDEDLHRRIQLAPEELARTGLTGGAYRSLVLRVPPSIKDIACIRTDGGRVDVVLLARLGEGSADPETVKTVTAPFEADDATQLTDVVSARATTILPTTVQCTLRCYLTRALRLPLSAQSTPADSQASSDKALALAGLTSNVM